METKLPYKWPLALDILKRQYDALPSQKLLAFQAQFFDTIGKNMELKLFGNVGYLSIDPKNIEAVLSTRFEGMQLENCLIPLQRSLSCLPLLNRFWSRLPPWRHVFFARRGYLHTRRARLETLKRAAASTVRANAVSKPQRFR